MKYSAAIVTSDSAAWTKIIPRLLPGGHIALLLDSNPDLAGVDGRLAGLVFRDTITVLRPGPKFGFALIFRLPIDGSSISENVLKHSVGGINIDATRIGSEHRLNSACGLPKLEAAGKDHVYHNGWKQNLAPREAIGRWPANLVIIHSSDCENKGTRKIKWHNPSVKPESNSDSLRAGVYEGGWQERATTNHVVDGQEEIDFWDCKPGCSSLILDALSGDLGNNFQRITEAEEVHMGVHEGFHRPGRSMFTHNVPGGVRSYGDTGGASRFFAQFADDDGLVAWLKSLLVPPDGTVLVGRV